MFKEKNKRAQIGTTLTWIVGFLIIFFIMVVYLSLIGVLVTKKFAKLDGGNEITSEEVNENLKMQRELFVLLDTRVEGGGTVKDLIRDSKKELLEEELNKFVNSLEPIPECYILKTEDFEIKEFFGLGGRSHSLQFVKSFLEKRGLSIILLTKEKKIKLEYYFGKC